MSSTPSANSTKATNDKPRLNSTRTAGQSSTEKNMTQQKAWTGAPLSQRAFAGASQANGNQNAPSNGASPVRKDPAPASTPSKRAHDRLVFLLTNLTGLDATVVLKDGESYRGVFSGLVSGQSRYNLSMTRRLQPDGSPAPEFLGPADDHVMSFEIQDTIDLQVQNASLTALASKSTRGAVGPTFQTDVEISGTSDVAKERELHRWQPGTDDRVDLTMDSGGIGDWDQFAANEKLYNVQTDFDESLYTTTIDRKDPKYKQAEQRAARLAREIERESASRKVAVTDSGLDEEDKYSGVIRGSTAQAKAGQEVYVPPSKRPQGKPQATPTAPNDPAIIFSQLARPGGSGPGSSSRTEASADAIDGSESEQRATTNKSGVDAPAINVNVQAPKDGQGAPKKTDNYYQDVYESFKQFTVQEKQRIQNHQKALAQQRNTNARQEKSVKLNDLRKFSQNFKLTSRVPEDLVPILAKSKEKQNEIRDKAEQQAIDQEHPLTKSSPTPKEAKPTTTAMSTPQTTLNAVKKSAQPGSGNLAPIQAGNSIQPTFKPDSGIASPSFSANPKLNVKAMEFRPNPGAASFAPGGRNTSPGPRVPQKPNGPSPSPVAPERSAAVFSFARPAVLENERQYSFEDAYNPLRLMLQETAADEQKMQQSVRNGGIPHAYRTAPTWEVPESNIEKSYVDLFAHSHDRSPVPITRSNSGMMPHQQQLPPHLQGGQSHGQGSPRYLQAQAQQYGHLGPDEQRIPYGQPNQRQRGGNGPQGYMYNGQAFNPQMQNYAYGMPPGSVGPGGHMRAMGANGQLLGHGPMSPIGAGGHMMVQQASNGAMAQQFGMYSSPGASHAQPHMMPGQMGGYAGSPRAHPMGHQGSQQSHNGYNAGGPAGGPMMMMMSPQQNGQMSPMRGLSQPQFPGSYAMQQRAMSSQGNTPRQ